MAQLHRGIPAGFEQIAGEDWQSSHTRHDKAFAALQAHANSLPDTTLKGQLLRWQVADGYAHYLVIKESPLTLQHIPMGDGYTIDAALIRGLRKADVIEQVRHYRQFNRLFSKRA